MGPLLTSVDFRKRAARALFIFFSLYPVARSLGVNTRDYETGGRLFFSLCVCRSRCVQRFIDVGRVVC